MWPATPSTKEHIIGTQILSNETIITRYKDAPARTITAGGVIHGGAVMALADSVGAAATVINLPADAQGTTTIESKTNFIGAAKVGSTIRAVATPIHRGRRTQVWQTRLETEEGRLVAVVTQTQMVL